MKPHALGCLLWFAFAALPVPAALIPVSVRLPGLPAPATGAGFSGAGEFAGTNRYVVFLSDAGNLVTNDFNGQGLDVFRRDLVSGNTELVSLTASGGGGSKPVEDFSVSADGRRIAFSWATDDPAAGDTNGAPDVYVRDLVTGTTRLVSVKLDGSGAGNGASGSPAMSSDGRYVAFASAASDLVAQADTNGTTDIFLRDLETGTTTLVSQTPAGQAGDWASYSPQISADGAVVVFVSDASNLAPRDGYGTTLFAWRRDSGAVTRITLPGTPQPVLTSPVTVDDAELSADGRYLALVVPVQSGAPAAVGIWWYDFVGDQWVRASGDLAVAGEEPSMAGDGRTLAFTVLMGSKPNTTNQVRIWNADSGLHTLDELRQTVPPTSSEPASSFTPLLSPDATGLLFVSEAAVPEAGVTDAGLAHLYYRVLATGATRVITEDAAFPAASFSADGSRVVFQMQDPVAASGDENEAFDLVVTTLADGSRQVVSLALVAAVPQTASGFSGGAWGLTDDGRFLAFTSAADDLVAGDHHDGYDNFVYDRVAATNQWVGLDAAGAGDLGVIGNLALSRDGSQAVFVSATPGLTPGDTNTVQDVFVRELATGVIVLASAADGTEQSLGVNSSDPQISGDGRWVAFRAATGPVPASRLYLRDLREHRTYWVNDPSLTGAPPSGDLRFQSFQLSADGSSVLMDRIFGLPGPLLYHRFPVPTLQPILSTAQYPLLSADGRTVVFQINSFGVPTDPPNGFYMQSLVDGQRRRLLPFEKTGFGEMQISADGSVLVYSRRADPILPAALRPWQVWALSVGTGAEELISVALDGDVGDADSRSPALSADGRFVIFRSYAANLIPNDRNGTEDVFARDRYTGVTTLLSQTAVGALGNNLSTRPQISADGRFAAFTTFADNLLPGDFNGGSDVVLTELVRAVPPDADGDGLPDQWELDHFGNLAQGATDDADGDGQANADEYAAHSVPTDAGSRLELNRVDPTPDGITLDWPAHAGVTYRIERRDALTSDATWSAASEALSGFEGSMHFAAPSGLAAGYFRVAVLP